MRLSLRRLHRVTRTAQRGRRRAVAGGRRAGPPGAGARSEDTEVGQLAESMNTLLAAVETQFAARLASEERMRQFLADASHELRTPLTSIRGYAELARMQRAAPRPTSTDADNLDRIESEGTRMSRLVDDLLLLARGDQGEPAHRELVAVDEVLADAVDRGARRLPAAAGHRRSRRPDVAVVRRPRPAAAGRAQPGDQRRRAHRPGGPIRGQRGA